MPPDPSPGEDARIWVGHLVAGHEAEHEQFITWLNGPDAQELFRRRRLTEYQLLDGDGTVTVLFKAPHTGDPRIIIDFLRYPGLWPDYWEFARGGRAEDDHEPITGVERVHWRGNAQH